MTEIENVTRQCRKCGGDYEAHVGHVLGSKIEFGGGYCVACREEMLKQEEQAEAQAKSRKAAETRVHWRRSSGIPPRFMSCTFANFDMKVDGSIRRAKETCVQYAKSFSPLRVQEARSMVLYSQGHWGLGKTHLVCALANAIIEKADTEESSRTPVYFTSEPQLFLRVKATFDRKYDEHAETEEDIYRQLTHVPLLILDDVGKQEVADPRFVQRTLFSIIDGRYCEKLPIIMTANLNPDGLEQHLGGDRGNCASMSRLAEMTGNIFYELRGEDYRDISKRRNP